jgi:hypothetical protein
MKNKPSSITCVTVHYSMPCVSSASFGKHRSRP